MLSGSSLEACGWGTFLQAAEYVFRQCREKRMKRPSAQGGTLHLGDVDPLGLLL